MSTTTLAAENKQHNKSFIEKTLYIILLALVALLPLLILPTSLIGFSFVKMGLITITTILLFVLLLIDTIRGGQMTLPSKLTMVAIAVVPIVTMVSAFLSPNIELSFLGNGYEFDTVHFIVLCFILVCLIPRILKNKISIFNAYLTFFTSFVVVLLIHFLRFIFGVDILGLNTLLPTVASNTIGAWTDFGTYTGLGVILSFITLEFIPLSKLSKIIVSLVLTFGIIFLAITNFFALNIGTFGISLTFIVGLIALLVFVYMVSLNNQLIKTGTKEGGDKKRFPWASLIVLIVCVICTVGAGPISEGLYQVVGISGNEVLDIRPDIGATFNVGWNTITSNVLHGFFGIGTNRFYTAWALYKPADVNLSPFWNTDFNYGSGYIPTFLTTTGVVGILAWLFFVGLMLTLGVRGAFSKVKDRISMYLILSSLVVVFYLWFMVFFTVTGPVTLFLAFFFTGVLLASLYNEKIITMSTFSWTSSQRKGFISVLVLILLVIASIAWAFAWTQKVVASTYATRAVQVLNTSGDVAQAETLMIKALKYDLSDVYLQTFAQMKLYELRKVFDKNGKAELTQDNAAIFNDALSAMNVAARNENPTNYQNWILLGSMYESAGLLGVKEAPMLAKQSYEEAARLNPTSPLPSLLLARLYVYAQNSEQAQTLLQQALDKKANFQEAYDLYTQLEQLKKTGSVNTAPGATVTVPTASSTASTTQQATTTNKR